LSFSAPKKKGDFAASDELPPHSDTDPAYNRRAVTVLRGAYAGNALFAGLSREIC